MYKKSLQIREILIDTNVILDFVKLILEPTLRSSTDRDQLVRYLSFFKGKVLYVVPQILAELYSLLKRDAKRKNIDLDYWLNQLRPFFENLKENYISKDEILQYDKFIYYGFTDMALVKCLEKKDINLITTDFALINYCKKKGLSAHHPEEILTVK